MSDPTELQIPASFIIINSNSGPNHYRIPMKYLLENIWKFVKQVSKRVTRMIQPPKETHITLNSPSQEGQPPQHKKLKRKRRSFKSFLKEQSQSRKMKKRQSRKSKKYNPAIPLSINQETSDFEMSIESQNLETEHYKQHFTNEMSPSCSAFFEDNNGLQISVIAAQRKPADQFMNKEVDSDEELLELICGEQAEAEARDVKREKVMNRRRRKNSKDWWQKLVEGAAPEMRVITIVDLTIDEDCPKIFHVPLALIG